MRTTADLDEEALAAVRALAEHEHISLGRAVNVLVHRGMSQPRHVYRESGGFPTFGAADGHTITDELVAAHRDDD